MALDIMNLISSRKIKSSKAWHRIGQKKVSKSPQNGIQTRPRTRLAGMPAGSRSSEGLVLRASLLPAKIEDLRDFVLLSSEKLNAYRAKIRAVGKLNLAKGLRDKAIAEGQILAEQVFYAEAKLGDLLKGLDLRGGDRKSESFKNQTSSAGSLKSLGITEKLSYEVQKIAAHPEVIDEVLEEAKRENEIPYKAEILQKIDEELRPELKVQRGLKKQPKGSEDPFVKAIERYGVWPTTLWEIDYRDKVSQELKHLIGDDPSSSTRAGAFSRQTGKYNHNSVTSVSIFPPEIAIYLINLFSPSGVIYDPFAGGGTRAIIAAKKGLRYVGVELRNEEVLAINRRLKENGINSEQVKIFLGDARNAPSIASGTADFLMTSPPYWNMEKYNGGKDDLSMCRTYGDFLERMRGVISESKRILKPNALSCWVGLHRDKDGELLPIHHDISSLHRGLGFKMTEEIILSKLNTKALLRVWKFEKGNRFLIRLHEYVLVFRKKTGLRE